MKKANKLTENQRQFINLYKNAYSERTVKEYIKIISLIERKKLIVKSKSQYNIVKSVLNLCSNADINLNYNLITFKRNTKKDITEKLISEIDLLVLLKATPKTSKGNELNLAIRISYNSGLRVSEVLSLTTESINIKDDIIELKVIGKGNKYRKAYLPISFKNELTNFSNFSITLGYVELTFNRMAKKQSINTTFHALRHGFALKMLDKGIKINQIQKLLGHSNISTTSIYLEISNKEIENSLKAIW